MRTEHSTNALDPAGHELRAKQPTPLVQLPMGDTVHQTLILLLMEARKINARAIDRESKDRAKDRYFARLSTSPALEDAAPPR